MKKKLYTSFCRPSAVAASSQSLHSVNYVMPSLRRSEVSGNTRALIPGQSHLSPGPSQADDVVGNQNVTSQVGPGGESVVYFRLTWEGVNEKQCDIHGGKWSTSDNLSTETTRQTSVC